MPCEGHSIDFIALSDNSVFAAEHDNVYIYNDSNFIQNFIKDLIFNSDNEAE